MSGSVGRLGLALVIAAGLAGVAIAETAVEGLAGADAYQVVAAIVPGPNGAEVCGERGNGHVDFRIGFGGGRLSVNGVDAGVFEPAATYVVTVACQRVGDQWLATTRVVNQATGAIIAEQPGYPLDGPAEEVRATAEQVAYLRVQ